MVYEIRTIVSSIAVWVANFCDAFTVKLYLNPGPHRLNLYFGLVIKGCKNGTRLSNFDEMFGICPKCLVYWYLQAILTKIHKAIHIFLKFLASYHLNLTKT